MKTRKELEEEFETRFMQSKSAEIGQEVILLTLQEVLLDIRDQLASLTGKDEIK